MGYRAHPPDLHTDLEPGSARLWKATGTSVPRGKRAGGVELEGVIPWGIAPRVPEGKEGVREEEGGR